MLEENKIHQGDCMELMKHIPDKSVDIILCDLPYGATACEWDNVLPLDELWKQYKRILKEDGVVVLTASQPFTTDLINSNRDWFRYELIWDKKRPTGMMNAEIIPLKSHKNILIFYKNIPSYNPQLENKPKENIRRNNIELKQKGNIYSTDILYKRNESRKIPVDKTYPKSIIQFVSIDNFSGRRNHPTEKPLGLFKWLVKTYTNEGELVLDNCMGSGTTAVACKQANRNFIGIELSQEYVDIANKRLQQDNLHAFFQTQGVLTEPSPNRNLKENSTEFSQISANAETSLNSDINPNKKNRGFFSSQP